MTVVDTTRLRRSWAEPAGVVSWFATVDHKRIGTRYMVTALTFFFLGGLEAAAMRAQLARADSRILSPEAYDQLFSMHGITMIFLFVTPMLSGFGNYVVPLQLGARDMAFPKLNALGYWIFLGAGVFMYSGLVLGKAPDVGWFNYVPLASSQFDSGPNIDFYGLGLIFLGISTTAGAVNFIVTILKLRAPGMSLNRIPLFCWAVLGTSFAILFAIPALTAASALLELDRLFGFHFFDLSAGGDPVLWQHLFWIFGHPDVYIIFLPAVGIVSTVVPTFARRPMVAYTWVALSTMMIAFLGFGVWVHHMFAVGLPQLTITFFAAASLVIAIPSGVQVFAWLATLVGGRPVLKTPLLYVLGFLLVFVIGGVTGVMFAVIPFDQQVTDTYFVVAHFHYVLFGGAVFPILAGIHYWLPKISGRMPSEGLGQLSFWLVFTGFNLGFFPMHISGLLGMPRRVYTYPGDMGWGTLNLLSTIGAYVLAIGLVVVAVNIVLTYVRGEPAGDDPWGAPTLEWATSSPPPPYNFASVPIVRSATPLWDESSHPTNVTLAEGHQTTETSLLEGDPQRALHMPSESLVPLAFAVALALVFVGLIFETWWIAIVAGALAALALGAWHWPVGREREA
ncbi:MAG TPA: cytochrome c oxidase subunit I [Gaiella sp.]|jgi:cytochrome c oxidase subunit 1/cytochrome c oxidase subunit I+III